MTDRSVHNSVSRKSSKSVSYSVINPDWFNGRLNLENILSFLYNDPPTHARGFDFGNAHGTMEQVLLLVQKRLRSLERADEEIEHYRKSVVVKVKSVVERIREEETQFKDEVKQVEGGISGIRGALRDLDMRVSQLSQTATRIGDRVQTANTLRMRALGAAELIGYLRDFSVLSPPDDFASLPPLFWDDATMAEAATVARRLNTLAAEVHSAQHRHKLVMEATEGLGGDRRQEADLGANAVGVGSVDHTLMVLEHYCNWLEARVVEKFDSASSRLDSDAMRECVRIMGGLDRERTIVQRWVSSRPMFLDPQDFAAPAPNAIPDPEVAVPGLKALYMTILEQVKAEVEEAKAVFDHPHHPLEMFLQRLFEQRVQSILERVLHCPAPLETAKDQRRYLDLSTRVFELTMNFAREVQSVGGEVLDLATMAEAMFLPFLVGYPDQELTWMKTCFDEASSEVDSPQLDQAMGEQLLGWNQEAVRRAVVIGTRAVLGAPLEGQGARSIRQLFYHRGKNCEGCLLEMMSRYIGSGLDFSLELCNAGLAPTAGGGIFSRGFGIVNRATSTQLAEDFVNTKVRKVLEAAYHSQHMVGQLQGYWTETLLPLVANYVSEQAGALEGMTAMVRGLEEKTLAALQAVVELFCGQVEKVLYQEQKRSDFLKEDVTSFDRPTPACLLVTAMVNELWKAVQDTLTGTNQHSFMTEVGHRLHLILDSHMLRFGFTPTGALRWKKDLSEYGECLRACNVGPAVEELINKLQAVVNVLIVAPESLLTLVNGTLRMEHKEALRYIQLREDFRSARVEGRTLQQLFTADGTPMNG